jgi:hypothetical protein
MRILEHRVGLSDAGRRTYVDSETRVGFGVELGEQLLASWTASLRHVSMLSAGGGDPSTLYELFMTFLRLFKPHGPYFEHGGSQSDIVAGTAGNFRSRWEI